MVTASLLHRGLSMADATEIARDVRDSVANREEITTEKLSARIDELIAARLGPERALQKRVVEPAPDPGAEAVPMVETAHGRFPFSRGVILRHLDTSGLGLDAAMELVRDLERWVRAQRASVLSEVRLQAEVARMLKERHGEDFARRYRLTDWVQRSQLPMIVLIGGATGTGKSTLAMELAYRLGVVWVTSTDLIRETMRTVLSPELVPGLHDHSFRGMVVGGQVLSDPRERVLAGFRQQAAQVAVGIRAVIGRAIRENADIIIEGTHLAPPFHQYVPPDAEVNLAGLILAVPDEKEHRNRFPERSEHQPERAAATYLDAFQSVRWIHDDLLRLAEDAEAVVLPNLSRARTLIGAVDFLSRELPVESRERRTRATRAASRPEAVPTLFLILDGLGDEPNAALGGRTPLSAARPRYLRRLAASGGQGQVRTARPGVDIPGTDDGIMALLGASGQVGKVGRGLFEALGRGLPIPPGSVVLRGNLATAEVDGALIDRRAGRIRAGVEELLSDLRNVPLAHGISGRIYPGHEHRVLVVLSGPGLSAAVSDSDPGGRATVQRILEPHPLDASPEAGRTAEALRELLAVAARRLREHPHNRERIAQGLLAANSVITRGAAAAPERRPPGEWLGAMVTGCNTALGVARYLGMKTASSLRMTGNLDTDIDAKLEAASSLLEDQEFVVVHIKGTDVAAHDKRPLEKRDFISAIDAALGRFLEARPAYSGHLRVVVSADHGTSSTTGNHLATPVPLLLATWQAESDEQSDFDEESSARGALGVLQSGELGELLGLRDVEPATSLLPPSQ
jgi:2,3-bisphosphoglycerate-independent phosphoglycerate mutase